MYVYVLTYIISTHVYACILYTHRPIGIYTIMPTCGGRPMRWPYYTSGIESMHLRNIVASKLLELVIYRL